MNPQWDHHQQRLAGKKSDSDAQTVITELHEQRLRGQQMHSMSPDVTLT